MTTQQRNSSDALYQRGFEYQTNPDYGHSKRPREKLLELPEDEFCYGGCQARRAKSEFSKTQLKQAPFRGLLLAPLSAVPVKVCLPVRHWRQGGKCLIYIN